MATKHGLGKGLDALLPMDEVPLQPFRERSSKPAGGGEQGSLSGADASGPSPGDTFRGAETLIPLDKLRANPDQPRQYFDGEALKELADSIREHGIIQPVIAEDAGDGTYTIVAGERRIRAARMAGLTEAPVIIRDYPGAKRMEVSLIENVQRADLNPIEEASAYKKLMELTGLSQEEVAGRVGKNRSTVANTLRLLKLPDPMREALEQGTLSPGHARAILQAAGAARQEALFREILSRGFSVREAEKRAADLNAGGEKGGGKKEPAPETKTAPRAPEIGAMEEKFIGVLGTKVVIEGDLNRGRIYIEYYSMEDLERLYEILGKETEISI